MSAAVFYHPEAYTISSPKLMGRNAAGESFLRGFLQHSSTPEFWVLAQEPAHTQHFAQAIRSVGRNASVHNIYSHSLHHLSQPGALYYPGPNIAEHAYKRARYGHGSWSLCGITHTTSSAGAMDALAELITSPVQEWDAVICTSTAVKNNVERVLAAQVEYLKDRLGIGKVVLPQLPVIPLGIHVKDFVFSKSQKDQARQQLGIDDQTLVVLYMGRLSFHAKAHPLAMYQALEQAAQATQKKVVLIECGWHANESIANNFAQAARLACPTVQVINLDGRGSDNRQTAWAAADVFCSLSDNIQETFGITPIEAMAAGLPAVVSDWDGYRDSVREGIDGFRIPTLMPEGGLAEDLALRHSLDIDTYDRYCGYSCSFISVDIQATAQAFIRLFNSPQLRQEMGQAGQKRATEVYDWSNIIARYESLWASLGEIRRRVRPLAQSLTHPWPARMDPYYAFSAYPTQRFNPQTVVALVDSGFQEAFDRMTAYRQLGAVDFASGVLPTNAELNEVLKAASAGPTEAAHLVAHIPDQRKGTVFRAIAWLLKLGVLRLGTDR